MKSSGILVLAMSASWLLAIAVDGQEKEKKLSDADIAKLLVGTWSMESETKTDAGKFKTTWVYQYNKDGTFKSEVTTVLEDLKRKESFAGKWKVAEGILQTTLTVVPPSIKKAKVGDKGKERVVAIGDTMLTKQPLKDDGTARGKEIVLKRLND